MKQEHNEVKDSFVPRDELKACPFAHTSDALRLAGDLPPYASTDFCEEGRWCVTCPVCRCSTAFFTKRLSAIHAWNNRADLVAPQVPANELLAMAESVLNDAETCEICDKTAIWAQPDDDPETHAFWCEQHKPKVYCEDLKAVRLALLIACRPAVPTTSGGAGEDQSETQNECPQCHHDSQTAGYDQRTIAACAQYVEEQLGKESAIARAWDKSDAEFDAAVNSAPQCSDGLIAGIRALATPVHEGEK